MYRNQPMYLCGVGNGSNCVVVDGGFLNGNVGNLGLEGFTNDVWLWFILTLDLVSVTFYTIPTSIFSEKGLKF